MCSLAWSCHSVNDSWSTQQYSTSPTLYTKQEWAHSDNLNPGLQLRYNRTLPANQKLRLDAYASYGDNDYRRWYEQREDNSVASAYRNETAEKSYYVEAKANYTKTFRNKSSLNMSLRYDYTHTYDHNLRDQTRYDVSLDKNNGQMHLTYNYRLGNRLSLQADLGGLMSRVRTGGTDKTDFYFVPYLKLSYVHKKHSFTLTGTAVREEASNANRTGDEYRINEYEIFVGNPLLNDYMKYSARMMYTWSISSTFTLISAAYLDYKTDNKYNKIYYDRERGSFVNTVVNSSPYWMQHYEAALQYNIIPRKLFVRAGLLDTYTKTTIWKTIYDNAFQYTIGAVYQDKGWRVALSYLSGNKVIDPASGRYFEGSDYLSGSVSYSIGRWNFRLSYTNPFKYTTKSELDNGEYEMYSSWRVPLITDNYGTLNVSYRFDFGKKKHKFDNTEVEDINKTTISK